MIERDFSDLLIQFGIDDDTAKKLENEVDGNDLTELVNDLSGNSVDINSANNILQKYNVQIDNTNEMYENIMNGDLIFENLKLLEQKDILDEDYQYVVNLDRKGVDPLIDYLDDKDINYFFDGNTEFKIDCLDRSQAYNIDRFISKIKPNETLRDNITKPKQTTMENKKMVKQRKKLKEASMLYSPEVIQMVSNAGLDMKRLAEAFDDMDDDYVDTTIDTDDDDITTDYDFSEPDGENIDVDTDDGIIDDVDVTDPVVDDYSVDDVTDTMSYDNSDAYTVITNSINDITNNLGNLKVSEFKMIIDSLTGLLDTAKDSGRTYLD